MALVASPARSASTDVSRSVTNWLFTGLSVLPLSHIRDKSAKFRLGPRVLKADGAPPANQPPSRPTRAKGLLDVTPPSEAPHPLDTSLPTSPSLHGPLARFLLHPQVALRDLGHLLAHAGWFVLGHLGPPVAALFAAAIIGQVLLARWRARHVAAGVVRLELRPPPVVDPGSAEVFWTNLHALLRPSWRAILYGRHQVAFEIRAIGERSRFTISAPQPMADHVRRAITAAWPGASVLASELTPTDRGHRASAGYGLRLARAQWLPIATDHPLDPLRSVLGAAAELHEDDEVVVQVVARPASRHRDAKGRRINNYWVCSALLSTWPREGAARVSAP